MRKGSIRSGLIVGLLAWATPSYGQIRITEWMYAGTDGEFVELTNMGVVPVDLTNWSYSDEDNLPDTVSLTALGIVAPGQSVVFTEAATAAGFRTAWGLPSSVVVLAGVTDNLGRNDAIYIYDAADALVDVLDFGDQSTPVAGPRTQNRSGGLISDAVLGTNNPANWAFVDTGVGDPHGVGFTTSVGLDTGNPGKFVPEPASLVVLGALSGFLVLRRRARA